MQRSEISRQILVVDDEAAVRTGIAQVLSKQDLAVATAASATQALAQLAQQSFAVVLLDIKLPDMDGVQLLKHLRQDFPDTEVIMITGYPTIAGAVECIKLGALDYLVKPFRIEELEAVVQKARDHFTRKNHRTEPKPEAGGGLGLDFILGQSPAMRRVFDKIKRAAPSDSTVLLTGESGTGKELAARAIHLLSPRANQEFVPVDCSALVETLLESELFGHVKGSFTGALQTKHGLFELANHGTFFFDEISNLSPNIQAKLLRVIQEREFMQVGSQKRIKLDIRIIASSNRDLKEAIKAGAFREDLYYRLSVIPIHLPPLRERTGDIALLVDHFLRQYSQKGQREVTGISSQALKLFSDYGWPGNVRELENYIERAVVTAQGDFLGEDDFPPYLAYGELNDSLNGLAGPITLEEGKRYLILKALESNQGNKTKAAEQLGITTRTIRNILKDYSNGGELGDEEEEEEEAIRSGS
jgi:DNA-binding NtrC family response regulator